MLVDVFLYTMKLISDSRAGLKIKRCKWTNRLTFPLQ